MSNRSNSQLEKSDNHKLSSNAISNYNSQSESTTNLGKAIIRSSSITNKNNYPLNQIVNESLKKTPQCNPVILNKPLNNNSERKSVVDVLTNRFREGNLNKIDSGKKLMNSATNFNKHNSIGSIDKYIK